jgi:hypothetical protein
MSEAHMEEIGIEEANAERVGLAIVAECNRSLKGAVIVGMLYLLMELALLVQ